MGFRTKINLQDNRQHRLPKTENHQLSGITEFGVPFSALTTGPDPSNSAYTNTNVVNVYSTFSGNSGETIFSFTASGMDIAVDNLSAITPTNSGATQETGKVWSGNQSIIIDGNLSYLNYTGVTYDLTPISMDEVSIGQYTGVVFTNEVYYLSAGTLDYTDRMIWSNVKGIHKTEKLMVTEGAQTGYVLTALNNDGDAVWSPVSGASSGTSYSFTNGLNLTGTTAKLGGDLIEETIIDCDSNEFNLIINAEQSNGHFIWGGNDIEDWAIGSVPFSYTPREYIDNEISDLFNIITGSTSLWSAGTGTNAIAVKNFNTTNTSGDYSINASYYSSIVGNRSVSIGGSGNTVGGTNSLIGGSSSSSINGDYSNILGGKNNVIYLGHYSSIIGGTGHTIANNVETSSIIGGKNNAIASGPSINSIICGGQSNYLEGEDSFILGSSNSTMNGDNQFILGGSGNTINGGHSTILNSTNSEIDSLSYNSSIYDSYDSDIENSIDSTIITSKNITISNTNQAIVLGCDSITALASGTTYVNKLAIVSDLTSGETTDNILMRNTTNGQVRETELGEIVLVRDYGTTANRPVGVGIGYQYFDTDLGGGNGMPIWWNGTNWVNATGAIE